MATGDDSGRKPRPGAERGALHQLGALSGAGIQFAVTVALGVAGGWWLDGKLDTSPLFLIAGGLFGAVAAFYHLYRTLVSQGEAERRDRQGVEEEE